MGIGGGIITKKLLFTVLLIASLSLGGISTASAAGNETVETQTGNTSTVDENVNTQTNNANIVNEQTETQNTVEDNVKTAEKADSATVATSATQSSEDQTQPISKDATSTTQTTSTANQNSVTTETNTQSAAPAASVTKQDSVTTETSITNQTSSQNTSDIQEDQQAAAGETKTTSTTQTTTSFTVTQIKDAASRVKAFIENKKELPNYVTIGTTQVQMPEFLKLLTASLLQLNSGITTPITLKDVNGSTQPTETVKSGTMTKTSYLDLAKRVNAFINANGELPNYASSSLGKMRSESLIYLFSKVLTFQKTNNRLPSYVTVKPWSTISSSSTSSTVPAELQKYLAATANCQVTNSQIKALAASITAGKTTTYAKAVAIFNWVRDKIGYSFYYNTKYGATGTLSKKTGNCVDTSHLLIALTRAAGIPARYKHVYAKFTSGNWYGHVIAQVYVNGKWYNADATSSRNTFGVINNWYTSSATIKGYYASLPF